MAQITQMDGWMVELGEGGGGRVGKGVEKGTGALGKEGTSASQRSPNHSLFIIYTGCSVPASRLVVVQSRGRAEA